MFEQVAIVDGAGNSMTPIFYFTTDNDPYEDISYYRLKQTDFDGKYEYSYLVAVNLTYGDNPINIIVYPNPAGKDNIRFAIAGEYNQQVLIVIKDVLGREFYSKQFILENESLAVSVSESVHFASGIYILTASSRNGFLLSSKIILE